MPASLTRNHILLEVLQLLLQESKQFVLSYLRASRLTPKAAKRRLQPFQVSLVQSLFVHGSGEVTFSSVILPCMFLRFLVRRQISVRLT